MIVTHRTRGGLWATCEDGDACRLRFHFPGVTPADMALVPESIMWQMCEFADPPTVVDRDGVRRWEQTVLPTHQRRHREYALPALIYPNGSAEWYLAGSLHRSRDLPAVVHADGLLKWYRDGLLHRGNDRPAVIHPNGDREWYQFGNRWRDDFKPTIEFGDGARQWWCRGQLTHELRSGETVMRHYPPFYDHGHPHSAWQAAN